MWGPLLLAHTKIKINENNMSRADVAKSTLALSTVSMVVFLWAIKALYDREMVGQCRASGMMLDWVNISLIMGSFLFVLQFLMDMRYGTLADTQCYDDTRSTIDELPTDKMVGYEVEPAKRGLADTGSLRAISAFMFIDFVWGFYGIILFFTGASVECHVRVPVLFLLVFVLSTLYVIGYTALAIGIARKNAAKKDFFQQSEFEVTYVKAAKKVTITDEDGKELEDTVAEENEETGAVDDDAKKSEIDLETGAGGAEEEEAYFLINGVRQKDLELEVDRLYVFMTADIPKDVPFMITTKDGAVPEGVELSTSEPVGPWATIAFTATEEMKDLVYTSSAEGGGMIGGSITVKKK